MSYVIEKGIPIPGGGKIAPVLEKLEVGDSVLICDKTRQAIFCAARRIAGKRFETRTSETGHRVWRTE